MPQIVDWGYYSPLYKKIKETDFDRVEELAEREVRNAIGPIRWANISADTFGYEALKDCICKVMEKMAEDEKGERNKGIASVSNDGYSETYVTVKPEEVRQELQSCIRMWLSGTGLIGAY